MESETVSILQKNILLLTQNNLPEYEYIPQHYKPLPSLFTLHEIIELLRAIIFPGYFGEIIVNLNTLEFHLGVKIERLYSLLKVQIHNGIEFNAEDKGKDTSEELSSELTLAFKQGFFAASKHAFNDSAR